ncbi:MAG: ABC transporter permease [Bacteroidia bacterium]|jgi:putative ABC transport system permease protein
MKNFRIIFTQIKESAIAALHTMYVNKVRTLLSTLGITIGIFCIIAVLAVVESFENNLHQSVESLGNDVVFIEKMPWTFGPGYKWWKYISRPNASLSELKSIEQKSVLSSAEMLTITIGGKTIKNGLNSATGIDIQGVTHDYYLVRNFNLFDGRYFTENESENGNLICLIGYNLAQTLFPNVGAVNKSIKISGTKFGVVGVFAKEGESLIGNSLDNAIIIPINAAAKFVRINSDDVNSKIHVKAGMAGVPALEQELNGIMRSQRKLRPGQEENFALNKITLITQQLDQTFKTVNIAGWIIGLFAMLVGGFGIANIMFVSVKERTNQIGIQKSLGAKNYFILIEFLIEAVILCLLGCIIGLLLVWGIIAVLGAVFQVVFFLSLKNIIIGVLTSVCIGVISGFLPALSASKLNPVDAIRSK